MGQCFLKRCSSSLPAGHIIARSLAWVMLAEALRTRPLAVLLAKLPLKRDIVTTASEQAFSVMHQCQGRDVPLKQLL